MGAFPDERARAASGRCRVAGKTTDVEDAIAFLRSEGFQKFESLWAIHDVFGLNISQLQLIFHETPTWADRRDSDAAFHNACLDALQELADEDIAEPKPK